MRQGRTLIVFSCLLLVLCGVWLGVSLWQRHAAGQESAPAGLTLTHFTAPVNRLELVLDGESAVYTRTEGVWRCEGREDAPLRDALLDDMARTAAALTALRRLDTKELDGALADCFPVERRVTALSDAGEQTVFQMGIQNPSTGDYYLRFEDDPEEAVYTVAQSVLGRFQYTFLDLIALDRMPVIAPEDLAGLRVTRGTLFMELFYLPQGSDTAYSDEFRWFIGRPYDSLTAADGVKAEQLFLDVTRLYIYGCAAYAPDAAMWKAYGLDEPMASVTLSARDGDAVTDTVAYLGGASPEGYTYVRFEGSPLVLLAHTGMSLGIAYAAASALLPDDICRVPLDTVEAMDVRVGDKAYRVDIARNGGETAYQIDGRQTDAAMFEEAYSLLTDLRSEKTAPDTRPGAAYLEITFHRNTTHHSEMTLRLYEYDPSYYLVGFDGRTRLLISREEAQAFTQAFSALANES